MPAARISASRERRAQSLFELTRELSAALLSSQVGELGAAAVQRNFDTYRALRIHEMPRVEVHIVASTEKPGGVGEPGVPPLAPAVANAVAKLGGPRVRRLPFTRAGLVES